MPGARFRPWIRGSKPAFDKAAAGMKWPVRDSFEEATPKLPQTGRPHGPGSCGGPELPAGFVGTSVTSDSDYTIGTAGDYNR
jgi:hypothetical protein